MSYLYLATAYTKYEGGIEAAYVLACRLTANLMQAGIPVFSPIAHSHGVALHGKIDALDHDIWMKNDAPMMAASCGLVVYTCKGWDESRGVRAEIDVFIGAAKPILFLQPHIIDNNFLAVARATVGKGCEQ